MRVPLPLPLPWSCCLCSSAACPYIVYACVCARIVDHAPCSFGMSMDELQAVDEDNQNNTSGEFESDENDEWGF